MSLHPAATPQPTTTLPIRIGVGIDTSRYGHYAAFLRDASSRQLMNSPSPSPAPATPNSEDV